MTRSDVNGGIPAGGRSWVLLVRGICKGYLRVWRMFRRKACPGLDPGWIPARRQEHAPSNKLQPFPIERLVTSDSIRSKWL
jgi:hypothetical protein